MKHYISILAFIIVVLTTQEARALTSLYEICDFAYKRLAQVKGVDISKTNSSFVDEEDNNKPYNGCVIELIGDSKDVSGDYYPTSLFYPSKGSLLNKHGWRSEREADGPDGSSLRIIKKDVFCMIRGTWDGGDDSDPGYIPSTLFKVTVKCGDIGLIN